LAAALQRRVGHHTHQPDVAAAIDETVAAIDELPRGLARRRAILRTVSRFRSGEDADSSVQIAHRMELSSKSPHHPAWLQSRL
jgi:hypothetical protein